MDPGFYEINRSTYENQDVEEKDPVTQLKTYFDQKNRAKTLHKAKAKLASQKMIEAQLNEISTPELNNEKNFQSFNRLKASKYGLHPNFVIAKYEKMAKKGKLTQIDQTVANVIDANGNPVLN